MKLFDYIKVLFGSHESWDNLKSYDKSKNSFMVNRFMAIKFPMQANMFNPLRTSPVGAAESWRMVSSKFKRVPGWIYTKVRKQKKEKVWEPSQETIDFYLKINEIGNRELREALKWNHELTTETLKRIEKQIKDDVHRRKL
tara:strand:+ start:4868 stop:5290 length:423 start_codon:yes stop_codon:yes gene_type:complete